jgi:protein involved in polysaccharide export with SLBB domain
MLPFRSSLQSARESGPRRLPPHLIGAVAVVLVHLLTGCGSVKYADPNPKQRFVFPGEPSAPSAQPPAAAPKSAAPSATAPTPAPTAPAAMQATNPPVARGTNIGGVGGVGVVRVGEMVIVSFADQPPGQALQEVKTRLAEDGKLTLPFNVTVQATGKTTRQLEQEIRGLYVPRLFNYLTVTVKTEERFYVVGGEVKLPGQKPYFGPVTVLRAIDTAGGPTDFANMKKIELTRENGQKVVINGPKAAKDSKLDPEVFPNDHITVPKGFW